MRKTILACLLAGLALPAGAGDAQTEPIITRMNGGMEVEHIVIGGECASPGPARIGAPASAVDMAKAVSVTFVVRPTGGWSCGKGHKRVGLRFRIFVPNVPRKMKILIIYVVRGAKNASASAHVID